MKNVILLAMSTLPFKVALNTYQYTDCGKTYCVKGISQLEAHTKVIIDLLADRQERVDRIVILSTPETRKPAKGQENFGAALELYQKRISAFVQGQQGDLYGLEDSCEVCGESYPSSGYELQDDAYRIVDLSDELFFWNAVNEILGNDDDKTHLWMDVQGGDRNVVAQMNAIVELLKGRDVVIEKRFANDFNPRENRIYNITDVSPEYRTYDLITAMQVFKHYGRGDELLDYVKQYSVGTKKSARDEKLVKAITDASDAIQWCNVGGFDKAIDEIAELKEEFDKAGSNDLSQMNIVFQDIYEDYSSLIHAKYRYVEQIRWCLKKNFVQQALTILESKMPSEYVLSGLKYYCDNESDRDKVLRIFEKIYAIKSPREKYKLKDINHYFIKDYKYDRDSLSEKDRIPEKSYSPSLKRVEKNINDYVSISGLRNKVNHAAEANTGDGFYGYMASHFPKDPTFKNGKPFSFDELGTRISAYICEFENLADQVKQVTTNIIDLR